MNVLAKPINRARGHVRISVALATLAMVVAGWSSDARAQLFYWGRPYAAFPVPAPIVPAPYYSPYYAPPFYGPPPGGVRIRTPFFSLNWDSDVLRSPSYPSYGYRYEAYRPSYRSEALIRPRYTDPYASRDVYRYSAGADGGIPDLTEPFQSAEPRPYAAAETVSLQELRSAAQILQQGLQRRSDDADVWLDYLRPDLIIAAAESRSATTELAELRRHYDGVVMNPDLESIVRLRGFSQTRRQLGAWLDQQGITPKQEPAPQQQQQQPAINQPNNLDPFAAGAPPPTDAPTDAPADQPADPPAAAEKTEALPLPAAEPETL
ncbi:hypothetical protein NHH03_15035 [Stieleria sp. TO1_6]|uniref:hypothetical protein n=1 Tax=Stieleria tagensis TaxID=2956795 RepID=UPI00209B11AB|nr:hypothetical protein [Stieleria tagensis]MCO8123060.1 hypothetical protein [Stieleria tagensis]